MLTRKMVWNLVVLCSSLAMVLGSTIPPAQYEDERFWINDPIHDTLWTTLNNIAHQQTYILDFVKCSRQNGVQCYSQVKATHPDVNFTLITDLHQVRLSGTDHLIQTMRIIHARQQFLHDLLGCSLPESVDCSQHLIEFFPNSQLDVSIVRSVDTFVDLAKHLQLSINRIQARQRYLFDYLKCSVPEPNVCYEAVHQHQHYPNLHFNFSEINILPIFYSSIAHIHDFVIRIRDQQNYVYEYVKCSVPEQSGKCYDEAINKYPQANFNNSLGRDWETLLDAVSHVRHWIKVVQHRQRFLRHILHCSLPQSDECLSQAHQHYPDVNFDVNIEGRTPSIVNIISYLERLVRKVHERHQFQEEYVDCVLPKSEQCIQQIHEQYPNVNVGHDVDVSPGVVQDVPPVEELRQVVDVTTTVAPIPDEVQDAVLHVQKHTEFVKQYIECAVPRSEYCHEQLHVQYPIVTDFDVSKVVSTHDFKAFIDHLINQQQYYYGYVRCSLPKTGKCYEDANRHYPGVFITMEEPDNLTVNEDLQFRADKLQQRQIFLHHYFDCAIPVSPKCSDVQRQHPGVVFSKSKHLPTVSDVLTGIHDSIDRIQQRQKYLYDYLECSIPQTQWCYNHIHEHYPDVHFNFTADKNLPNFSNVHSYLKVAVRRIERRQEFLFEYFRCTVPDSSHCYQQTNQNYPDVNFNSSYESAPDFMLTLITRQLPHIVKTLEKRQEYLYEYIKCYVGTESCNHTLSEPIVVRINSTAGDSVGDVSSQHHMPSVLLGVFPNIFNQSSHGHFFAATYSHGEVSGLGGSIYQHKPVVQYVVSNGHIQQVQASSDYPITLPSNVQSEQH